MSEFCIRILPSYNYLQSWFWLTLCLSPKEHFLVLSVLMEKWFSFTLRPWIKDLSKHIIPKLIIPWSPAQEQLWQRYEPSMGVKLVLDRGYPSHVVINHVHVCAVSMKVPRISSSSYTHITIYIFSIRGSPWQVAIAGLNCPFWISLFSVCYLFSNHALLPCTIQTYTPTEKGNRYKSSQYWTRILFSLEAVYIW